MVAAHHGHACDIRLNRNAAGSGKHACKCPCRTFDRIDALRTNRTNNCNRRAIASKATDLNLWVRGLIGKLISDDATDRFGGIFFGLYPPRVGNKDKARAVNLHFFKHSCVLALRDQQTIVHVFPDRQAKRITSADCIRANNASVCKASRKAQGGRHSGDPVYAVVNNKNKGIALFQYGTRIDFGFIRPRTGQAT